MNSQRTNDQEFLTQYMRENHPDRLNLLQPVCHCGNVAVNIEADFDPRCDDYEDDGCGYDVEVDHE